MERTCCDFCNKYKKTSKTRWFKSDETNSFVKIYICDECKAKNEDRVRDI